MKQLIEQYKRQLGNLESNLNTNYDYFSDKDMAIIKQRISDFRNFIYELEQLSYRVIG